MRDRRTTQYLRRRRGYTVTAVDAWREVARRTTFGRLRVGDTYHLGGAQHWVKTGDDQTTSANGWTTKEYTDTPVTYTGEVTERFIDAFTRAYLECAEWADANEDAMPEGPEGWSAEAIAGAYAECIDFQRYNARALRATGAGDERNGHDFWLTRNRHGAGFWDRGYPGRLGEYLTRAAQAYGECYVYVGDNGKLYTR